MVLRDHRVPKVSKEKLALRVQLEPTDNRMVILMEEKLIVFMAGLVHYWAEMRVVFNGSSNTV
jgi:hypothetical protein